MEVSSRYWFQLCLDAAYAQMSELRYQGLKFGEGSSLPSGSPLSHDVTVCIWNNYWIEPDRLSTIRACRNVELRNVKQHIIKNFFLSDLSKALPKDFYSLFHYKRQSK